MYNHVPAYGMHSYSAQRPQSYFGGQGYQPYGLQHDPRNPFTGAYQVPPPHLTPYMWSAPPPPPPPPTHVQEYKTPAPPEPAPPVEVVESKREKELDPELEKLKQELERRRKEQAMKEEEKRKEEMEARLQKQAEEAIAKKMDDMKRAQAEAQVQIEKAKEEAAIATRAAIEAEKKAEEQKELLFQEALRKAEQEAREKVEAEAQRRLLNEEMQHRAFLEAKEKLAKEAEERRLQQEEEDEKRKQLLQDLRDEIRAEILAEESGALGSPRSTNRAMHSSRVANPSYGYGRRLNDIEEDLPIRRHDQPMSRRDETNRPHAPPYWPQRPRQPTRPLQTPNIRDSDFDYYLQGRPDAFLGQPWFSQPEGFDDRGWPARPGPERYRPRFVDPNERARFQQPYAEDDGSESATVIPPSANRTNSRPGRGRPAKQRNSGPAERNSAPRDEDRANEASDFGMSGLNLSPDEDLQAGDRSATSPRNQNGHDSSTDDPEETTVNGSHAKVEKSTGTSQPQLPEANSSAHFEHSPVPQSTPIPSSADFTDLPGGNRPNQGPRVNSSQQNTTRNSPLLPYLAKHLSEFEERASRRNKLSASSGPPQFSVPTGPEDHHSHPDFQLEDYLQRTREDMPDGSFPMSTQQLGHWRADNREPRGVNSRFDTFDYAAAEPFALVPFVLLPVRLMQPMQGSRSRLDMTERSPRRPGGRAEPRYYY